MKYNTLSVIIATAVLVMMAACSNQQKLNVELWRASVENNWGFIDKQGEYVISPQFYYANNFREGLAPVILEEDGKEGYINRRGKIVINPQFDIAYPFKEGLASVEIGEKWGYINKQGKIVINPQFDYVNGFKNGISEFDLDRKLGYVDKQGNIIYLEK